MRFNSCQRAYSKRMPFTAAVIFLCTGGYLLPPYLILPQSPRYSSSRPFSGLALNTSSGCKKASPETVSLSAALSPYPRLAQPPAPCGRFAPATLFPRVS